MLEPLPILPQHRKQSLFEGECRSCQIYDVCGGAFSTPCGCIWKDAKRRYQCHECWVVCREPHVKPETGFPEDTFLAQITSVKSLDQVPLIQSKVFSLPVFIPLRTCQLPRDTRLPLRWAGVGLRYLLSEHVASASQPRRSLRSPEALRAASRVVPGTQILGVLNASDILLERFWGMKRSRLFSAMQQAGVGVATGPTFSVYYEDAPASHNVTMLMRHHQVMYELQRAGHFVIPNLYWRDYRDRLAWVDWLKDNPSIGIISREFAVGIKEGRFLEDLAGLIEIIQRTGRRFHVLLVGVGVRTTKAALLHLDQIGCTATVVSPSPIMEVRVRGQALEYRGINEPAEVPSDELFESLAIKNIHVMERFVTELAASLDSYRDYGMLSNRLPVSITRPQDRPSRL